MVNGRAGADRRKRGARLAACGWLALSAASCTLLGERDASLAPPVAVAAPDEAGSGAPRYASYACGALGAMTVENFQTSALVVPPDGPSAELPARPAGQSRRFSSAAQSLVLEEGRAVLSRSGQPDLVCTG
ncbi:MAG TPA: hypothetical protein VGN97_18920 [Mesorhizobium sp.]|jgi:hypothetical protein|nr:hypothetical protein [Mesorhizobium sp.]